MRCRLRAAVNVARSTAVRSAEQQHGLSITACYVQMVPMIPTNPAAAAAEPPAGMSLFIDCYIHDTPQQKRHRPCTSSCYGVGKVEQCMGLLQGPAEIMTTYTCTGGPAGRCAFIVRFFRCHELPCTRCYRPWTSSYCVMVNTEVSPEEARHQGDLGISHFISFHHINSCVMPCHVKI